MEMQNSAPTENESALQQKISMPDKHLYKLFRKILPPTPANINAQRTGAKRQPVCRNE